MPSAACSLLPIQGSILPLGDNSKCHGSSVKKAAAVLNNSPMGTVPVVVAQQQLDASTMLDAWRGSVD
jgi:hypothetical protein